MLCGVNIRISHEVVFRVAVDDFGDLSKKSWMEKPIVLNKDHVEIGMACLRWRLMTSVSFLV